MKFRMQLFFMIFFSLNQIENALFIPSKFVTMTSENTKKTLPFAASLSVSLLLLNGFPADSIAQNILPESTVLQPIEQSGIEGSKITDYLYTSILPQKNLITKNPSEKDSNLLEENSDRDKSNIKNSKVKIFTPFNQMQWKLCYAPQTKNLGTMLSTDLSIIYAYDDKADDKLLNNGGVSSHIFYKNIFFNGWINISGEYQDVSEILCRVVWKDLW